MPSKNWADAFVEQVISIDTTAVPAPPALSDSELLLLVEDDEVDAMAMRRTIKKIRPSIRVIQALNGKQALECLAVERPDLIIMDIKMPQMNGKEALAILKQDEYLRKIPVVMMSTSADPEDVSFCYQNYSNAYMVKPMGPKESLEIMTKVIEFWFGALAKIPGL